MAKLNVKLWKCRGSFVENAPSCDDSIVTTKDDERLEYGNTRYYLCNDCKNWNSKWENQVREKMLKSLLRNSI